MSITELGVAWRCCAAVQLAPQFYFELKSHRPSNTCSRWKSSAINKHLYLLHSSSLASIVSWYVDEKDVQPIMRTEIKTFNGRHMWKPHKRGKRDPEMETETKRAAKVETEIYVVTNRRLCYFLLFITANSCMRFKRISRHKIYKDKIKRTKFTVLVDEYSGDEDAFWLLTCLLTYYAFWLLTCLLTYCELCTLFGEKEILNFLQ